MSLRPDRNRFHSGGIITPESITPEIAIQRPDLAPPVDESEQQTRDCIAAITAQIPKALEDMQHERIDQTLGFKVAFRRYGDFLMIEMERTANKGNYAKKFATTLNLGKVSRISITHGRDVTVTDETFGLDRYSVCRMRSDETFAQYYARNPPIKTPLWRPFIHTTEISALYGSAVFGHRHDFDPQSDHFFHVEDVPQPSVDDLLVFHGSESFHIPWGRGDDVLKQVMKAIEKGWEKTDLKSLTK